MSEAGIAFECVDKRFGTRHGGFVQALSCLSLSCPPCRITCLVGPTGCGKTTALRIAAGLDQPDAGVVRLPQTVDAPARLGYLTQQHTLFPWLRLLDNVALPLQARGVGRTERRRRALECLQQVGLADAERLYPHECSGGMQQRAMFARLLAAEATVWLLDEPFNALDERTRRTLRDLLLRIQARDGLTVLMVTHDLEEAVALADRVAVLSLGPGRLQEVRDLALPRPRDPLATAFGQEVERLRRALDSQIVLDGPAAPDADQSPVSP